MPDFIESFTLLLVLLNPFLTIIYLTDVVEKLDRVTFAKVLARAGLIASGVFCAFALAGDAAFRTFMRADFASFQIFGGVVLLLIALQFVFKGPTAIEILRGDSEHLSGAIAMPVLIGPGTISGGVVIGERLNPIYACAAIVLAVGLCIGIIALLKLLHDYVKPRNEGLIRRYIEVAGRITALFAGTIAVEMIMTGLGTWIERL